MGPRLKRHQLWEGSLDCERDECSEDGQMNVLGCWKGKNQNPLKKLIFASEREEFFLISDAIASVISDLITISSEYVSRLALSHMYLLRAVCKFLSVELSLLMTCSVTSVMSLK